jgi:hypothetical protein
MVQAYAALNRVGDAVRAQEVVAESRDTKGAYTQLAVLAWQAGQTRKGDLARDRAIELEEPDLRESLRGQLQTSRQQALGAAATGGDTSGG